MNKKNIILILVGILIISMRFNVTFGHINIDVTNDCVGFLLIIIGVLPMINRNSRFKKSGIVAIVGFIASVIAQIINFIDWQEAAGSMLTISLGITVIFAIYFTYYFTEAIILEAKFQEKSATTRSFRIVWLLLGALVFIHYIAFMSNISLASILVGAGSGICAIYYCSTMLTACKQLYMEGLPTKHMDISAEKASKK